MPTPQKGESQDDYIGRCVKQCMDEGLTQKQALGKCYGMWREKHNAEEGSKYFKVYRNKERERLNDEIVTEKDKEMTPIYVPKVKSLKLKEERIK